ncbi:MAG: CBS domain-containing protein [Deltaproteobacteria bacterium]|nr:CBS domain-containing protein [Deltaproteobacteria bacterium]
MLKAKDIMTKDVISISPDLEVTQAAQILLQHGINGLPVVKGTKLVGILCQSDLIAQQKKLPMPSLFTLLDGIIPLGSTKNFEKALRKMAATTVADAMTSKPVTVGPETELQDIATLMLDKNFHTIPVVDHEELIGIIGKEDVLKTIVSGR